MLVLYRRHEKDCKWSSKGRKHLKCACSIWLDWRVQGKRIQKPIGTRNWQSAQMRARQLEAEGITSDVVPQTLAAVCKKFLQDAQARGLRESSLYKYELVLSQLQAFGKQHGLVFLSSFGVQVLRSFRESWTNKNLSARKKLEHLRAFFRFCNDSGWIKDNPAKAIKPPKTDDPPVLPFQEAEMQKILASCQTSKAAPGRAAQLRALILLMRHTGLRLGDATTLKRDRIQNGILELWTEKSGTKVRIPLKPELLDALGKIPKTAEYYFWSGQSSRRTLVNIWSVTFASLFKRAGIQGHSHRLRHTFAVDLLQHGVSMEDLSKLLGHRSIRVTEKHYASWVPARQDRLEEAVRRTWVGNAQAT